MGEDREFKTKDIILNGKLINSIDGTLIGKNNFSTLTNFRYTDNGIKSIQGCTKVNTTPLSTYLKMRNGIHFKKEQPAENHVLVQAHNTGLTASQILQNTTAIPNQGNFSSTALHTDASNAGYGRFSEAPDGCVAYCNGEESMIWGGNEYRCARFINYATDNSFKYDYTKVINNTLTDSSNIATIHLDTNGYLYIGSTRPISGAKFYVQTANTNAATASAQYWSGTAWTSVSNLSDGTASAGKTLAQTGLISFDSTVSVAKASLIENVYLYWYKFIFTGISAGVQIYYCTLSSPMQNIVDLWDGILRPVAAAKKYDAASYTDYTLQIYEDSHVEDYDNTYIQLGLLPTTNHLYLGFPERLSGLKFHIIGGTGNTTANTNMYVGYWNGTSWTPYTAADITDGTKTGTISFNKSGYVTWPAKGDNIEFETSLGINDLYLYWYRISFSQIFSTNVKLYYIAGIPVQKSIKGFKFPLYWRNKLWLCSEKHHRLNTMISSVEDSVCIFNGTLHNEIPLGKEGELIAGVPIYTLYGDTIYEAAVVCKKDETWLLNEGENGIQKYRISDIYGCIAPLTMRSCDLGIQVAEGVKKHIAIWQSAGGMVMFDVDSIKDITTSDIGDFFDPSSSNYINTSIVEKFYGFYDSVKKEYHWLFATGSNTTLNKEYILDILRQKWFEVDRDSGNYLQAGFPVSDTNGNRYIYGAKDTGYLMRLDYGTTFDGTAITSTFKTGDFPLEESTFYETAIRKLKLYCKAKNTTTNDIVINYYADTVSSATKTISNYSPDDASKRVIRKVLSVNWLNAIFHSLQCSLTTSDETIGFEPLIINLGYKIVREDIS